MKGLTKEEKCLANKRVICMGIVHTDGISLPIAETGMFDSLWIPLVQPLFTEEKHPDGTHRLCIAIYRYKDMVRGWEPNHEGTGAPEVINQLGPPTSPLHCRVVQLHGRNNGQTPVLYFGRKPGFLTLWADIALRCEIMNYEAFNDALTRIERHTVPPNSVNALGLPTIRF